MIRHDVFQGSPEWLQLRIGLATASEFHRIITPKTGQLSKQARPYAYRLIAEKLLNRSLTDLSELEWIEHGRMMEPEAIKLYEFEREARTELVGFLTTDDGRFGASPDRLVGDDGLLEIKCPAPQTQVCYLVEGFDDGYAAQVQGQLLVAEREWVDWLAYNPELPRVLLRTYRDDGFIAKLSAALEAFCDLKDQMEEHVRRQGVFHAEGRVRTITDEIVEDDQRADFPIAGERYFGA